MTILESLNQMNTAKATDSPHKFSHMEEWERGRVLIIRMLQGVATMYDYYGCTDDRLEKAFVGILNSCKILTNYDIGGLDKKSLDESIEMIARRILIELD